jgi:hypothetical protein
VARFILFREARDAETKDLGEVGGIEGLYRKKFDPEACEDRRTLGDFGEKRSTSNVSVEPDRMKSLEPERRGCFAEMQVIQDTCVTGDL